MARSVHGVSTPSRETPESEAADGPTTAAAFFIDIGLRREKITAAFFLFGPWIEPSRRFMGLPLAWSGSLEGLQWGHGK